MSENNKPGISLGTPEPDPSEQDWEARIEAERIAAEKAQTEEALKEQKETPKPAPKKSSRKKNEKSEEPAPEPEKKETPAEEPLKEEKPDKDKAIEEFLKEAKPETEEKPQEEEQKVGTADVVILVCGPKTPEEEAAELNNLTELGGSTRQEQGETIRTAGTMQNKVFSTLNVNLGSVIWNDTERRAESKRDLQLIVENKELMSSADETAFTSGPKQSLGGRNLSGEEAIFSILARVQGLTKVYLFNSGFHVSLRPPTNAELSTILESLDMESMELGRQYGGFSYLADGVALKRRFMELLPAFVVKSNLKNYENPDVLRRCLSVHDYDTILLSLCSLMYKNGFDSTLACLNPKCVSQSLVKIDFSRVRFNTLDRITPEAKQFVLTGAPVTEADLIKYRDTCMAKKPILTREIDDKTKIEFEMQVPTMDNYIRIGEELLSHVFSIIHGEHSYRNEDMVRYYGLHSIRMILPWVKSATTYRDGTKDIITTDPKAIGYAIDGAFEVGQMDDFRDIVSTTRVSHICYPQIKCERCGRVPGISVNDYYPVDMEQLFFALSSLYLVRGA